MDRELAGYCGVRGGAGADVGRGGGDHGAALRARELAERKWIVADSQPRLYTDLASWFHLLTAPEDYGDEADYYWGCIVDALGGEPQTLLELGSGGGNMALHYKRRVTATLTDLSSE